MAQVVNKYGKMAWMEDFAATICPLVEDTSRDVSVKKKHSHKESALQEACVSWFRYEHPHMLLAAIPNGGRRDKITGAILKREGALAGMPDLFLFLPASGYHGLAIEMKTKEGTQQNTQKEIEKKMSGFGYRYIIVRSFEDFVTQVEAYIHNDINNLKR